MIEIACPGRVSKLLNTKDGQTWNEPLERSQYAVVLTSSGEMAVLLPRIPAI